MKEEVHRGIMKDYNNEFEQNWLNIFEKGVDR